MVTANGRTLLIDTQTGKIISDLGGAYKGVGGGGKTFTVGGEEIQETGDTFTDTVNYLKSLRDQNMLNDYNYREQINALMEVQGYDETKRSEVESVVNQAMEKDFPTEEDNNPVSDFVVGNVESPIETRIAELKEMGFKPAEIRITLREDGYNDLEITNSSAGSWSKKTGEFFSKIGKKISQ